MMGDWIPIVYYGTEQGFNGGSDPKNRESLWPYMSTANPLYKFIQTLAQFRRSLGNEWIHEKQMERHVQTDAYAFSKGSALIVITNLDTSINISIRDTPYQPGDTLGNILNPSETLTVSSDGSLSVTLSSGQPLVLYKK